MKSAEFQVLGHASDADWLTKRRSGIGASEMPALLGLVNWSSPLQLYAEKKGLLPPNDAPNEAMRWGVKLEPQVLEEYRERTQRQAAPSGALLRSTSMPWALATLDGLTRRDAGGGSGPLLWDDPEVGPLEIKTSLGMGAPKFWDGGVPMHVLVQATQQMMVTGSDHATVAALLTGPRFVWQDVDRDERLVQEIKLAGSLFAARLERDDPPEATGTAPSVLLKLWPEDDGTTVVLPLDAETWCAMREEGKARLKEWDEYVREAEDKLKQAIGSATAGSLPDGTLVTWKTVHKAGYTVEPKSYRELRVLKLKAGKK